MKKKINKKVKDYLSDGEYIGYHHENFINGVSWETTGEDLYIYKPTLKKLRLFKKGNINGIEVIINL